MNNHKLQENLFEGHADSLLLRVIADHGPIYGSEIVRQIQQISDDYNSMNAGHLYPTFHRLSQRGWFEITEGPSPRSGAPVSFYRITQPGMLELERRKIEN